MSKVFKKAFEHPVCSQFARYYIFILPAELEVVFPHGKLHVGKKKLDGKLEKRPAMLYKDLVHF